MLLLHIFFFSFLSCCLAEEDSALADKSLPKSEYITPLAGDIMELPFKENPASNLVNVEEILRELRECRQKNRNLNETIDNILEEMADMKDYIVRNEQKITSVAEDVVSLTDDVVTLMSSDEQQEIMIEDNIQRLDTLSTRGRWCGYQNEWSTDNSIITYDSYFFTDTNMDVSVTPLDITTGIKLTNICITLLLTFVSLQASSLCP